MRAPDRARDLARRAATLARSLAVAAAPLAGCVAGTTFDGPEPPAEEVAVLEGYWHYYVVAVRIVQIHSVDGKPVRAAGGEVTRVTLPPGRHRVELGVLTAFGEAGATARCTFEAQFERGHHYRIESFDDASSESEIGLELKTSFAGSATTRSVPCRRVVR